jgi:hypothetical protein
MKSLKMNEKIELSLTELRNLFLNAMQFEKEYSEVELELRDEEDLEALDFGDYLNEVFNIQIK